MRIMSSRDGGTMKDIGPSKGDSVPAYFFPCENPGLVLLDLQLFQGELKVWILK